MEASASNKIAAPVLPPTILHREALVKQLRSVVTAERFSSKGSAAHYKLLLLCTPAGYGKTTLLADFAQATETPCCWYFLDQNDADGYTFLRTLLASIRQRFPGFGATLDPLLAQTGAVSTNTQEDDHRTFETFIDILVTAIDREISRRFAILLCNYQEVDESQTITNLVNHLLQKMPSQCVLIIESRATPSIEFASLLAHHQVVGWGSNMLRMNAKEILALARIQDVVPPSKVEAEQLAMAFDGWITGILLGTRLGDAELLHTSSRTGIIHGLPTMRVGREKLFAYLVNEIFSRQPTVYTFLKEVAILQQLDPEQCNALLGITNAEEYLSYLARKGMFVSCNDNGPRPIYTCQPVLRELLCDNLRTESPERFAELQSRAAQLLRSSYDYDKAIPHALLANDIPLAAQLIIEAYEYLPFKAHTEIFLRWLDAIPPETVESSPKLLVIYASILLKKGEHSRALPLLDSAATLSTDLQTSIDPNGLPELQTEIMLLRSKALFQEGKYHEAQVLCQQVLDITPVDEVTICAEAHIRFGVCADCLGDLTSGIEHLQKALQLLGRHSIQPLTADAHSALASSYNLLGNFPLAAHHISCAISCCEQLHNERDKVNNLTRLGVYKQRQGAFIEAETVLHQALNIASDNTPGFEREQAYILVNLGSVYQDQGHYDQSLKTLEQGLEQARQVKDNYLVNCSLCYLAMTYLLMGDASTALLLISETNLPPLSNKTIGYEHAIRDLTYGTILLKQKRYDDAYAFFIALEASLKMTGLKRELLRIKLRIAACQLARSEIAEALHYLGEVTSILEQQSGYMQLILTDLSRLPDLHYLVKTLPALEQLRNLLHIQNEGTIQVAADGVPSPQAKPASLLTVVNQPELRVQAFGEPAVFLDEQLITRWRMARAMELFFLLLDSKRPMRKEQIITALWPQVDEQINQTFHSTIHYLRKALNESFITSLGGSYSLDLSQNKLQYDVASFEEHHRQAKQLLANENSEEAKAPLLAMVELYQGDYLQPFYNDWCAFRRDELRRIYLEARNHLANIAWRQEQFDESASHWQHILAMDNWREDAHYGLIRYYLRTGKRGMALRQYQRCVETLQKELSVQPGPAIQSLYQRITGTAETVKKNAQTTVTLKENRGLPLPNPNLPNHPLLAPITT